MIWISKKDPMPLSREAASLATKHNIPVKGGESGELSIYRVFFNCSSRFSKLSKWGKKPCQPNEELFYIEIFLAKELLLAAFVLKNWRNSKKPSCMNGIGMSSEAGKQSVWFTVDGEERNGIGGVREILLRVREIQRESGSNFPWMERALTWLASRYIMKCVLHKPGETFT